MSCNVFNWCIWQISHSHGSRCFVAEYAIENDPCGLLLTLGQGDVGQLGLGEDVLSKKKPAIVTLLSDKPMRKITAGGMHTICLTKENEVCFQNKQ